MKRSDAMAGGEGASLNRSRRREEASCELGIRNSEFGIAWSLLTSAATEFRAVDWKVCAPGMLAVCGWFAVWLLTLLGGLRTEGSATTTNVTTFATALRDFRAGAIREEELFRAARAELLTGQGNSESIPTAAGAEYLAAAQAVLALRLDALAAAAKRLGLDARSDRVDPWLGADQEHGWRPDWTEIVVTNAPRMLKSIPAGVVGGWIPARYRLAEVLGLGTNRVHAAMLLVDPAFETSSNPRYLVESVIRYTLVGTFSPVSERSADGHVRTNAPADSLALETYRRELDSRRRVIHLRIHAGPEVRPDRTSEVDSGFEEADTGRSGGWFNDRLADRLVTHSWPRRRSEAQRDSEAPAESALATNLAARLHEWQALSREDLRRRAGDLGLIRKLEDSRAKLIAAERGPEPLREADLLPITAERLPGLDELAASQDFSALTRQARLAELHALVHAVEPMRRERAALVVLAVMQAFAGEEPKTTDEHR